MAVDICVVCGAPVPEGRHVCPSCEVDYSPEEFFSAEHPKTNAETIRNATNESLAGWMYYAGRHPDRSMSDWLEWLSERRA